MDKIFTAEDQPELFQVEGQLSEEDALWLEEESGIPSSRNTHGEIFTPFRAISRFSIGQPIPLPLAPLLTEYGAPVPADIQLQMQNYEFCQVQLACSFMPAPGCRFHDANFGLALQTLPTDPNVSAQVVQSDAIAYDLFPLRIEDYRKVSVNKSFSPELKFKFDPVSAALTLPLYDRSEEYVIYTSQIVAYDLQGTQPGWTFTRTSSYEINGTQKLFMILRKPKGTRINATFSLTARVQFMLGNLALDPTPLIMVFRRRGSSQQVITDTTVALC